MPGPGRLLGAWQLAASFLLPAAEVGRGPLLHGPACGARGGGDCCALEGWGMWGRPVTAGRVSTSSMQCWGFGPGVCEGALEVAGIWGWPVTAGRVSTSSTIVCYN